MLNACEFAGGETARFTLIYIVDVRGHRSPGENASHTPPSDTVNCGQFAIIEGRLNADKPLVNARGNAR